MDNENKEDQPNVQADNNSIAVGGISIGGDIRGNITIGHTGYTVEQVSVLLRQITSTFQPKAFDGRCPYKGLGVFEEEDADLFFGREKLVDDLINRVKESRTVFITGPSGSGKSSLVRAGLIHALKQDAIKNLHSERWLYETMKPGREPIKELALAFSRLKSPELANYFKGHASEINILNECAESVLSGRKDQRFVLFIDQFEEVFTQISQEEERLAFLNMLTHAGTIENGRVIVLFAMRSDFVSNCATYPALNEMLSQQFRQIGAMQPEELVSAIALPAKHVGLPIEDELIARIINDMKGEPGALPLMQFALKDLFDSQQEKGGIIALTLEDYLKHGGIHKSLERHADKSFATLSENEQELARSIFSGLIEIGRGTSDTRRTALFDELVPANAKAAEVESVVQRLADARLIITDEQAGKDTVTISHEKLIDAWPWLKKLVNENRDVIALQNEIAGDAKEWDEKKRDTSYLYSGGRLANVREQLEKRKLELTPLAREFVKAGRAKQRRAQIVQISGIAVVLAASIITSFVFQNQSQENIEIANTAQAAESTAIAYAGEVQRQANINSAAQLAVLAQAKSRSNLDLALLLSVEAWRKDDNSRSRGVLLDTLLASPHLRRFMFDEPTTVINTAITGLAFSPDGRLLITASCGEDALPEIFCASSKFELWDVNTGRPIGEPIMQYILEDGYSTIDDNPIVFSSNNQIVGLGTNESTLGLFDVQSQQEVYTEFNFGGGSIALSPNGQIAAISSCDLSEFLFYTYCPLGDRIILLNFETGKPIGQPLMWKDTLVSKLAFSADGHTLTSVNCAALGSTYCSSAQYEIVRWQVKTGELIDEPFQVQGRIAGLSPDGTTLVTNSSNGTNLLWDTAMSQQIGEAISGRFVGFSPDGKVLAISERSGLNDLTLWIARTGEQLDQVSRELPVAFGPDGRTFATVEDTTTIILWDQDTGQRIDSLFSGSSSRLTYLTFSRDGKMLAAGNTAGNTVVLDLAAHSPITRTFIDHDQDIAYLFIGPTNGTLSSMDGSGTVHLWDIESQLEIGRPYLLAEEFVFFTPHPLAYARCVKWSDNGGHCLQSQLIFLDATTGQQTGKSHTLTGQVKALSPNGQIIATTYCNETDELFCVSEEIILWDSRTDQPIGMPLERNALFSTGFAFSSDGEKLASVGCVVMLGSIGLGCAESELMIWNVATHQVLSKSTLEFFRSAYDITFSPSDQILAVEGDGGTVLWDVDKQQTLGRPLDGPASITMAFSPDGKTLAAGGCGKGSNPLIKGEIILWDVITRQPVGQPLRGHVGCVTTLVFSQDGKTLWSASDEDTSILQWDLDIQSWIEYACDRVGRNLTRTEWADFFSDKPYPLKQMDATCPAWPIEAEQVATSTLTPSATAVPVTPVTPATPGTTSTTLICSNTTSNPADNLIDINMASEHDLDMLPGIGPTTAHRIIEYRETNGPFISTEDLMNVGGIGPSTFDQIRDYITISCLGYGVTPTAIP